MSKFILAAFLTLIMSSLAIKGSDVYAQTSNTQVEKSLEGLRGALVHSFATEESALEIMLTEHVLTVSRLNSYLNDSSHVDRNNEAVGIVSVIQKEISGKPEFETVLIIRVQYILHVKDSAEKTVIDTIEFRKNQSGVFEFHST